MPVGLEINDFDSEEDFSSTEDDNINEPSILKTKNKKIKKKGRKSEKKSILKESKFMKDKAKKKIKNMEKEVKDANSINYFSNEGVSSEKDSIREFYTDEELVDQLNELEKLQQIQRDLWKVNRSHVAKPKLTEQSIRAGIIGNGMSSLFKKRNTNNNSRTTQLNMPSRVNTNIPILGGRNIINRSYNNIGRMW